MSALNKQQRITTLSRNNYSVINLDGLPTNVLNSQKEKRKKECIGKVVLKHSPAQTFAGKKLKPQRSSKIGFFH